MNKAKILVITARRLLAFGIRVIAQTPPRLLSQRLGYLVPPAAILSQSQTAVTPATKFDFKS